MTYGTNRAERRAMGSGRRRIKNKLARRLRRKAELGRSGAF